MAKIRELKEKDALIEDQAAEIGKLRVNLAETKVIFLSDFWRIEIISHV